MGVNGGGKGEGKGAEERRKRSARGRRSNHHLSFFSFPWTTAGNTLIGLRWVPKPITQPNLFSPSIVRRVGKGLSSLASPSAWSGPKAKPKPSFCQKNPTVTALPVLSHSQDTNAQKWRRRRRTSRRLRAGLRTPCGPQQLLPQPEARRRHRQTQQWRRRRHVEACTRARAGTAVRTRASGRRGRM